MGAFIDDLQAEPTLWEAFCDLDFTKFAEIVTSGQALPAENLGPCRKRGVTASRILEFVARAPGVKRGQIGAALGLKGGTLSSQLRTLRATGRVKGVGDDRNLSYFLPEDVSTDKQ